MPIPIRMAWRWTCPECGSENIEDPPEAERPEECPEGAQAIFLPNQLLCPECLHTDESEDPTP